MGPRGALRRDCCAAARRDRGAAAVEFALVVMPLFALVFGILQYGFLFFEVQGAASAAKDGARAASQGISSCTTWRKWTLERASGNGVTDDLSPSVSAVFQRFDTGDPVVTVTVRFSPNKLVPLVPVPTTVTRTAVTDVENVPSGGVTSGCP